MSLTSKPARTDLTDRELTKFIGSVLSGLLSMTDLATLRNAVKWWAESDEAWRLLGFMKKEAVGEILLGMFKNGGGK